MTLADACARAGAGTAADEGASPAACWSAAAIVFVVCVTVGDGEGAWGYVQATAEASMVGGLADWFAVTALFRHPLGLPIPHTAIIPRKKDQIGAALAGFVQQNFLTAEVVGERLAAVRGPAAGGRVAGRTGATRRRLADELGAAVAQAAGCCATTSCATPWPRFADASCTRSTSRRCSPGPSTRSATRASTRWR